MKGTTKIITQIKMVSVGQPKTKTIVEDKGDIHVKGNRKHKVW